TIMTLQPVLAVNWLPLMVTSLFIIYLYLPVRLVAAIVFATFYSAISVVWWFALYGGPFGPEHVYFGLLWIVLGNGLGFAAANALQRGLRVQYAQKLVMQRLLATDALTGIANRRSFDEALARDWRRCARAAAADAVDDRRRSLQGLQRPRWPPEGRRLPAAHRPRAGRLRRCAGGTGR